jgi:predicted nucleic acid-binding protein
MARDVYLLDTNVLSNSSKAKPHLRVAEWLEAQQRVAIPFTAFLEMEVGIILRRHDQPARYEILRAWMDGLLGTEFEYPELNPAVAKTLAELMCCGPIAHLALARSASKKPGQDLLLAAIAIEYNMPIATLDWKDFGRIRKHFRLPPIYNPAFDVFLDDGIEEEDVVAAVA